MKSNKAFAIFFVSIMLSICFVFLKVCNLIKWGWWFVLAPYWIPLIVLIISFAVVLIRKDDRDRHG